MWGMNVLGFSFSVTDISQKISFNRKSIKYIKYSIHNYYNIINNLKIVCL